MDMVWHQGYRQHFDVMLPGFYAKNRKTYKKVTDIIEDQYIPDGSLIAMIQDTLIENSVSPFHFRLSLGSGCPEVIRQIYQFPAKFGNDPLRK